VLQHRQDIKSSKSRITYIEFLITDEFSFMGAIIIEEVLKELLLFHGLAAASKLYLAGAR